MPQHDTELLNIFWVEVGDYLQKLNAALLQAEVTPNPETESLREMNRLAHSMKGAARAVGIGVIEKLAYYLEEIFSQVLKGKRQLTPEICDLLYSALDIIQNTMNRIETSTDILATTVARLEQAVALIDTAEVKQVPPEVPLPPPLPPAEPEAEVDIEPFEPDAIAEVTVMPAVEKRLTTTTRPAVRKKQTGDLGTVQLPAAEESIRVPVSRMDRLMGELSELLVARMHSEERQRDFQRLQKLNQRHQREWRSVRTAYIRLARRLQNTPEDIPDEILTLFRFLEENQRYLQNENRQLSDLSREMAQFNAQLTMLTEQLQDDISSMRLVPMDYLIGSFQRLVRDLARDTGREVQFDIVGATVEVDKSALDALKEPIMHLLRNAIDHGIEPPSERKRLGKPTTGRVSLTVEQRGKEILIRVIDDGRGLDAQRLSSAALQRGVVSTQEVATMTVEDIYNLVFQPGFSTRNEVTPISGRGMGMDIVRTRVESLRGRVSIESKLGKGSTFLMRIPVSLTRISCILLKAGGQDYAVPSMGVTRMLKAGRDQLFTAEGREMIMIDQQPIPVIALAPVLGGPAPTPTDEITLVVLTAADRAVAFLVDELSSETELVLKQLGKEIEHAPYVSGGALLGTGDVIVVLDVNDLIRGALGYHRPALSVTVSEDSEPIAYRLRVLVVDDSITTRTLEKHILETAGFDVHVAVDGQEGWEKINEISPDVVISDVEMPRLNGLELCQRIKSTPHTSRIPVVLLTSLGKPEQREAGLKAGADAYLVKSRFEQSELLRVIQMVV